MSANTGVPPHCQTALAVAMNDREGTMTSSPGPTPAAYSASANAVVQLVVATASGAPTRAAKASSKALTRGPCDTQPEAITSATAALSLPVKHGRANGTSIRTPLPEPCGRSEEHTSELQSRRDLVCRLLLEKKDDMLR